MTNSSLHSNLLKAAFLTGCFFMYACENDVNEVRALGDKKVSVEEGRNIESFLSMNGKMRARLTAPLLLRYDDTSRRSEFPHSLHVDFYNDSTKQIESQLNANYGVYRESSNKVYLRDNVVFFDNKGDTLFCKDLYWDQTLQKFYTSKEVTSVRNYGRTRFTAIKGVVATQDFSNISFNEILDGSYFFIPDSTRPGSTVAPVADSAPKPALPRLQVTRPAPKP